MMGMMSIEAGNEIMLLQSHDDPHNKHLQMSPSDMSHEQMMQSSNHTGSNGVTCEILCSVPASLLPLNAQLPAASRLIYLWSMPDSPEYISNLHTLLFKPPRA
jgi:hypothetical protein